MENKITSSENTLRLIDPSAKIKSTATFKALENFINGEIIKINFTENRKHSKRNILNIELKIKPKNRCRNVRKANILDLREVKETVQLINFI